MVIRGANAKYRSEVLLLSLLESEENQNRGRKFSVIRLQLKVRVPIRFEILGETCNLRPNLSGYRNLNTFTSSSSWGYLDETSPLNNSTQAFQKILCFNGFVDNNITQSTNRAVKQIWNVKYKYKNLFKSIVTDKRILHSSNFSILCVDILNKRH